jgi:uncharacterized membrane protein
MFPIAQLAFDNVTHPWLWLMLIAVGAGVLGFTYLGIFQRSQRRLTWVLLPLRALGILALVLALARPTWTREEDRVDPGRLAVIVDNSVSMSLADPAGRSRYDLARQAVDQLQLALAADGSATPLRMELFDINGAPLPDGLPAEPRAERTDLVRAVTEAASRLRSRAVAGVVLISDGADNTGQTDIARLAEFPAPIHAVGFHEDAEAARLDLAVLRVTAPPRAMLNNEVQVEVLLSKSAGPAAEAAVTIHRGQSEFAARNVAFPEGASEQRVSLTMTPREAGRFVFTAAVASQSGERMRANNAQHFALEVEAQPIRVLYIEGYLRYEYKYLKARLEDDPDISLVSVVRRTNPETGDAATSGGDLLTPERLANFDVLILGDLEGSYFTPAEYQALNAWIEGAGEATDPQARGHALLVLGGYQSFGPDGWRATPLADALPVVFADAEPLQSEDPFTLSITPEGQSHPMFKITGDRAQDATLWAGAPQLAGVSLVARAKPGAEVLARDPSFVRNGEPAVVVATQRYGAGRTLVITADTTWRWSRLSRVMGQSDTLFARFWSQTIRWLAGRDEAIERPPLVVSTDRPDYEVGKPVVIRALRQARSDGEAQTGDIAVEVTGEAGQAVAVEMRSRPSEPDVFEGKFYPSAGGRHEVAAALSTAGKVTANQAAEFLVHGSDLELANPGVNRPLLQSLASMTGGVFVEVGQAAGLVDKLDHRERRVTVVERTEFGDSPWLFLVFLAAVTGEWLIRRNNHLV